MVIGFGKGSLLADVDVTILFAALVRGFLRIRNIEVRSCVCMVGSGEWKLRVLHVCRLSKSSRERLFYESSKAEREKKGVSRCCPGGRGLFPPG